MAKNSWNNGRIIRAEQSANLDANDSNRIFQITYDYGLDDDVGGNIVGGTGFPPNTANLQDFFTSQPIIIKEYEVTVAADDLVMVHQYYGDEDQIYEFDLNYCIFIKNYMRNRIQYLYF